MKVVASRDFLNVTELSFSGFTDADGKEITTYKGRPLVKGHIPKGARFEIGTAEQKQPGELSPGDQKKTVQLLPGGGANCIVLASNVRAVELIDKQVAQKKAHDEAAKAATPASIADILAVVNKLMESNAALVQALAAAKPVKA
jgi:hypothetical protein